MSVPVPLVFDVDSVDQGGFHRPDAPQLPDPLARVFVRSDEWLRPPLVRCDKQAFFAALERANRSYARALASPALPCQMYMASDARRLPGANPTSAKGHPLVAGGLFVSGAGAFRRRLLCRLHSRYGRDLVLLWSESASIQDSLSSGVRRSV